VDHGKTCRAAQRSNCGDYRRGRGAAGRRVLFAVNVKKGSPLGAKVTVGFLFWSKSVLKKSQGFMSFTGEDTPMDRMIKRYCKGCTGADPLAVPYFIHKQEEEMVKKDEF
jgi:hypothetical protein